jgi:tripartite ATP-independent transporter DctP family solute receptor
MKKLIGILCAIVIAMPAAFAADASVELRMAHHGIKGEVYSRWADEFAAAVKAQTENRINIKVFGAAQLGNVNEMIDGVKSGSIDIALHDASSLAKFVPDMAVFNAPYVYRDPAHAVRVNDPFSSPVLMKLNKDLIEKAGIRVISGVYRGARQISSKFPVYSPADLAGKRMRGVPLPIWVSMIKGIGAIPTPMDFSELATALATGVVVAQENPLNNIWSGKIYEVSPFISMTSHMESVQTVFINEKSWQKIGEKDKATIERISKEYAQKALEWTQAELNDLKQKLIANKCTIIDVKDGLKVDEFRKVILAQINKDFPNWTAIIAEIQAIK